MEKESYETTVHWYADMSSTDFKEHLLRVIRDSPRVCSFKLIPYPGDSKKVPIPEAVVSEATEYVQSMGVSVVSCNKQTEGSGFVLTARLDPAALEKRRITEICSAFRSKFLKEYIRLPWSREWTMYKAEAYPMDQIIMKKLSDKLNSSIKNIVNFPADSYFNLAKGPDHEGVEYYYIIRQTQQ